MNTTLLQKVTLIVALLAAMSMGMPRMGFSFTMAPAASLMCGFTGDCWYEAAWRLHQLIHGYYCADTPWGSYGKNC